jgi:hypothetical protein
MEEPGVYVVRVYRNEHAEMTGVVESVATGEQLPFHSTEQLWHALRTLPSPRRISKTGEPDEEERQ